MRNIEKKSWSIMFDMLHRYCDLLCTYNTRVFERVLNVLYQKNK